MKVRSKNKLGLLFVAISCLGIDANSFADGGGMHGGGGSAYVCKNGNNDITEVQLVLRAVDWRA